MLGKVPKARTDATLIRTTACRAQADGRETYACIAVSKGHFNHGLDRAANDTYKPAAYKYHYRATVF